MSDEKIANISNIIQNTQSSYMANAGTISKRGFNSYKQFIGKMNEIIIRETNDLKQSTVWDKIKKLEKNKNGV